MSFINISTLWKKEAKSSPVSDVKRDAKLIRKMDRLERKSTQLEFSEDTDFCPALLASGLSGVLLAYGDKFIKKDKYNSRPLNAMIVDSRFSEQLGRVISNAFARADTVREVKALTRVLVRAGLGKLHFDIDGYRSSIGTVSIARRAAVRAEANLSSEFSDKVENIDKPIILDRADVSSRDEELLPEATIAAAAVSSQDPEFEHHTLH